MERKKVTAYDLKVGDRVYLDGHDDIVTDWRIIPEGGVYAGQVEMVMKDYGCGIFDSSDYLHAYVDNTSGKTQYTRILEALSDAETIATAKRIYEALNDG